MTKYGECCAVMALALERGSSSRPGLYMGTMMNFKKGETTDAIVVEFRRAKRKEAGRFGWTSDYANASYAPVKFCPFCGAKGCVRK